MTRDQVVKMLEGLPQDVLDKLERVLDVMSALEAGESPTDSESSSE